jgi:hypothetical protein
MNGPLHRLSMLQFFSRTTACFALKRTKWLLFRSNCIQKVYHNILKMAEKEQSSLPGDGLPEVKKCPSAPHYALDK